MEIEIPPFGREPVTLCPGPGQWVPAKNVHAPRVATKENSPEVVKKFGVIPAFDGSETMIVQHAMPCLTPEWDMPDTPVVNGVAFKSDDSPYAPGIKCPGVRSGRRSAIIPASTQKGSVDWIIGYDLDGTPIFPNPENPEFHIRIKGCGMWLHTERFPFPGITLKPLPSVHHRRIETIEIRGTAFPATVTSEIWNNPRLVKMFDKFGLRHNNTPLGFWLYAPIDNDPAPNIQKAQSIMKTCCDRRLQSNCFAGLENMISLQLSEDSANEAYKRIQEVYQKHGIEPPSDKNRSFLRVDKLWKFEVNEFNMNHLDSTEGGEIVHLTEKDMIERGFVPSYEVYKAIEGIEMDGKPFVLLAKLFGRLGWEAGRSIACVHRAGYNWGSYQDHSDDGMLDNSHPDNICVAPTKMMDLGNGKYQLLMPIDFDMSFQKDQVVNIWVGRPYPDPTLVTEVFSTEFGCMMMDIAGYSAALEGVATGMVPRDTATGVWYDIIWAMRDISAWEYVRGYSHPGDPAYEHNDITLEQCLPFLQFGILNAWDRQS